MSVSNQAGLAPLTVSAGSAIAIYRYVALAADGKFDKVTTNLLVPMGVSGSDAAADEDAFPMDLLVGIVKVEAGAATTVGAQQMSDSTGRTIDLVTGASKYVTGVALDAAGAAGEIIRVLSTGAHQDVA
jgi:hypothetical protein